MHTYIYYTCTHATPEFATRGRHGEARPARLPEARAPLGAGPAQVQDDHGPLTSQSLNAFRKLQRGAPDSLPFVRDGYATKDGHALTDPLEATTCPPPEWLLTVFVVVCDRRL